MKTSAHSIISCQHRYLLFLKWLEQTIFVKSVILGRNSDSTFLHISLSPLRHHSEKMSSPLGRLQTRNVRWNLAKAVAVWCDAVTQNEGRREICPGANVLIPSCHREKLFGRVAGFEKNRAQEIQEQDNRISRYNIFLGGKSKNLSDVCN